MFKKHDSEHSNIIAIHNIYTRFVSGASIFY